MINARGYHRKFCNVIFGEKSENSFIRSDRSPSMKEVTLSVEFKTTLVIMHNALMLFHSVGKVDEWKDTVIHVTSCSVAL